MRSHVSSWKLQGRPGLQTSYRGQAEHPVVSCAGYERSRQPLTEDGATIELKGQEPGPIVVRRAEGRDMEALLTIEQQCFNVYYYDYYMLDRRDFEFYLHDTDSLFFVATQGGRVVGDILGPVDPWRDPPSAHIDSIAVLPDAQNRGIGSLLLESFTREARRQGCTTGDARSGHRQRDRTGLFRATRFPQNPPVARLLRQGPSRPVHGPGLAVTSGLSAPRWRRSRPEAGKQRPGPCFCLGICV